MSTRYAFLSTTRSSRGWRVSAPSAAAVTSRWPCGPPPTTTTVVERQATLAEAMRLRGSGIVINLASAADVRGPLEKAALGGVLDAQELLDVASTQRVAQQARGASAVSRRCCRVSGRIGATIAERGEVVNEIGRSIDQRGEVLDAASPALGIIRRDITSPTTACSRGCRTSSAPTPRTRCRSRSSRCATGATWCRSRPTFAARCAASCTTSRPAAPRCSSSRWRWSTWRTTGASCRSRSTREIERIFRRLSAPGRRSGVGAIEQRRPAGDARPAPVLGAPGRGAVDRRRARAAGAGPPIVDPTTWLVRGAGSASSWSRRATRC